MIIFAVRTLISSSGQLTVYLTAANYFRGIRRSISPVIVNLCLNFLTRRTAEEFRASLKISLVSEAYL